MQNLNWRNSKWAMQVENTESDNEVRVSFFDKIARAGTLRKHWKMQVRWILSHTNEGQWYPYCKFLKRGVLLEA